MVVVRLGAEFSRYKGSEFGEIDEAPIDRVNPYSPIDTKAWNHWLIPFYHCFFHSAFGRYREIGINLVTK